MQNNKIEIIRDQDLSGIIEEKNIRILNFDISKEEAQEAAELKAREEEKNSNKNFHRE